MILSTSPINSIVSLDSTEVIEGKVTCGARISCTVAGISPVLRVLRFTAESLSESPSEIWARIAPRSGVGESEDESEDSEDEEVSVDESDESSESSSDDKALSCEASVVIAGRN